MENSPKSRMTLSQAIAGRWQIPAFVSALAVFVLVMILSPHRPDEPTFDVQIANLQKLGARGSYEQFYDQAEKLRQASQDDTELARVHGLAAKTRAEQLRQRHELGLDRTTTGEPANYDFLIQDYREAIGREWVDPTVGNNGWAYRDIALAYWALQDQDQAIRHLEKGISLLSRFEPLFHEDLVKMYMRSRPAGYLDKSMQVLETLLGQSETSVDDKGWAFVRKADVLIAQGKEEQALAMLKQPDPAVTQSRYSEDAELMYGKALRQEGDVDGAELKLRELLERLDRKQERGDLYAQTLLELGDINYEQFRDYDATLFYEKVLQTQVGTDWHTAALYGMGQCAAMQQRFGASLDFFRETVDKLLGRRFNPALRPEQVRQSLAVLSEQLGLQKEYELALQYMEIERRLTGDDDVLAARRFAGLHEQIARKLKRNLDQAMMDAKSFEPTETEQLWVSQQQKLIRDHFQQAGQEHLAISKLVVDDDDLYGESLWAAAIDFDQAGEAVGAIDIWRRFVAEREGHPHWPMALFHLGQAYRAVGRYDEAIDLFLQLRHKHPSSPAAYQAMVPLAKCFLAVGQMEKAENELLKAREDRALTPLAPAFREATFELGRYYYDQQAYPQAISYFSEAIDRYPNDPEKKRALFFVADAYRKYSQSLQPEKEPANGPIVSVSDTAEIRQSRRRYLGLARQYYDQVISAYQEIPQGRRTLLDDLYLRHAWLYRADCLFDLEQYPEAAAAYEDVVLRFQLTPTALSAFSQIINCHLKLGQPEEARAAHRRAVWQLRKMPDETFADDPLELSRQEWEDWLGWLDESGLW